MSIQISLQTGKTTSVRRAYDSAWLLGVQSKDVGQCRARYTRCGIKNIVTIIRTGVIRR